MSRVLVIGLDAATLDLVEPWAKAGKLPLFAQLMREGACGTLWSTVPAISPPAWLSIITGQNPGKHGIFDFVRRQPGTYNLQSVRSDFTRYRTVFDLLSAYGKRVAAINIPMTYPPSPVNGIMISGLGAPAGSGRFTHPTHLRDELLAQGYHLMQFEDEYVPGQDAAYEANLIQVTQEMGRLSADLLRREAWDLFFVVFRGVDEAQSFLWHHFDPTHPKHDPSAARHFGDAILRIYQATEKVMQSLLEAAGDDVTVLVVSDHGGGSLLGEVYLNAWLCQQGWMVLRQPGALAKTRRDLMQRFGLTRDALSTRLANPLALKLRQKVPLNLQHALLPSSTPTLAEATDWTQTKAYSFGCIGQIYVNLRGREPMGIVEPGQEREELIGEITHALYQLTDPRDGERVVDRVYRSEELYHGPYEKLGADLNVVMRKMGYITHLRRELGSTQVFGAITTNESGTHRPNGLFIARGKEIEAGSQGFDAHVVDVTPTILSIMGVPLPNDLDGRVLDEAVRSAHAGPESALPPIGVLPERPVATDWESQEDEQAVMERLKQLGYLE